MAEKRLHFLPFPYGTLARQIAIGMLDHLRERERVQAYANQAAMSFAVSHAATYLASKKCSSYKRTIESWTSSEPRQRSYRRLGTNK